MLAAVLDDPAAGEVIVVLDGCTDDTADVVGRIARDDSRVRRIELSPNAGPQRARLVGVRAAAQPVVLCLDDDVVVSAGCVAGHAHHHERRHADVVVGYMPVADSRRGQGRPVVDRYARIYESHCRSWSQDPGLLLTTLWGGNISFRRDDYLQAAPQCDPTLRFFEDQELGFVLKRMGKTALFDPELRAVHLYERDLEATLRDLRRAGNAYAHLLRRYPEFLPTSNDTFGPEMRNPLRRWLVQAAAGRPIETWLVRMFHALEGGGSGERWAAALLRLLTRAQYYEGFVSSGRPRASRTGATS